MVTQLVSGDLKTEYSNIITVEVGKIPATVTMNPLAITSGQASYTSMKEETTEIQTKVKVVATIDDIAYDVLTDGTDYYLKNTAGDGAVSYYALGGEERTAIDEALAEETVVDGKITLTGEAYIDTLLISTYRFRNASGTEIAKENQLAPGIVKDEPITIDAVEYASYIEIGNVEDATTAFTISPSITGDTANVFGRSYTLPQVLGENYVISIHWNDDDAYSDQVKDFQSKYNVKFVAGKYRVTGETYELTFAPDMNGTLSASDAKGILRASGSDILVNAAVTLTAYPEPGYQVKGWTVGNVDQNSTENTLTITMDDDKAVAVTFQPTTSTLTYGVDIAHNHGSVTADYYDPTTYQTKGGFVSGNLITANTPVRFVATPEAGYVVSQWEITRNGHTETVLNVDGVSNYTPNTFLLENVAEPTSVTVHFAEKQQSTITVKVVDEDGNPFSGVGVDFASLATPGAPTVAMLTAANTTVPSLTNQTFSQHDNVSIVLDVPVGVTVRNWSGTAYVAEGKQSAQLFNLGASHEITITCSTSNNFELAFSANAGGAITAHEVYVDGSVSETALVSGASYSQGKKIQFTMTPDGGSGLERLTVNGKPVTATKDGETYTYVTTLSSDLTATAAFAPGYVVTYNQIPGASYSFILNGETTELANGAVIPAGSHLVATLTPDSGLALATLTAGDVTDDTLDLLL